MTNNLFIGQHRIHLSEVGSTNNYARTLLRDTMPMEGTVITTDNQTSGRGQRSNSWSAEPNLNLTCTYILRPAFLAAKDQFMLSAAVALSVFDVVREFTPIDGIKIKWPNDILVGEKKIAGILIENSVRGMNLDNSIVGIGLNVNQVEFEQGLNATSLLSESGDVMIVKEVLETLNGKLEARYLQLRNGNHASILSELNRNLYGFEEERVVQINGSETNVRILGARPSGELQLQHADGRNTLHQHHEIEWNLKA